MTHWIFKDMAIPQRLHFLPLKVTAFVSHNYSYLQHYKLLSLAKAGKGGKKKKQSAFENKLFDIFDRT